MPLQNFIARNLPTIKAAWLNQVDVLKFTVFNDASTKPQARTALELDAGVLWSGVDSSGIASTVTLTLLGPVTGLAPVVGTKIAFTAAQSNIGATTATVNGSAPAAVLNQVGGALTGGELSVPVIVSWTGAAWRIISGAITPDLARQPAEITALVFPNNYLYVFGDLRRYGAVLDNVTDDFVPMTRALAVMAVSGGRVIVPGLMAVASANVNGGKLFAVGANTEIVGIGREASKITITGATVTHLFTTVNKKTLRIADISIVGNSQSAGFNDSALLYWQQDNTAVAAAGNVIIENCMFSNCKNDYWLYFLNVSTTLVVEDLWIRDTKFVSLAGNSRDPTSVGSGAYCVAFQGVSTNTVGLIKNVHVNRCNAAANFIKGFGASWHGSFDHTWSQNIVESAGQTGANDDRAGYAILTYDNSGGTGAKPDLIRFFDNVITSPRSCGFYIADCNRIYCNRNIVNGQTDQTEVSLPKGAIVCNGATYFEAVGNYCENCFGGVVMFGIKAADVQRAVNNTIISTVVNSFGVRIVTAFAGNYTRCEIIGNDISVLGAGANSIALRLRYTATAGVTTLIIKDNTRLEGNSICCFLDFGASIPAITYADIRNNTFAGVTAGYGLYWTNLSATKSIIDSNRFTGTWSATGLMLNLSGSTRLTVRNNEFNDMTAGTGFALGTDGAQGRLEGNRFNNVSAARSIQATGSEDLGLDTPTWVGNANDFIQNIKPVEAGAAASKYIQYGWQWDGTAAAWLQQRSLTGN